MAQTSRIVDTIKQLLKHNGITYRALAAELGLSESAIKQMFASGDMNLSRLDRICAVLSMDVTDLLGVMESNSSRLSALTLAQEQLLVSNPKLLLMAYCTLNRWSLAQILESYAIEKAEAIKYLVQLDRMQLVELLPDNRAKILVTSNFDWLPNGPIETYFRTEAQGPFFDSSFDGQACLRLVKNGDLSANARQALCNRLEALGQYFDDVATTDRKLPLEQRDGVTMVLAIRNWEFEAFVQFKRDDTKPV